MTASRLLLWCLAGAALVQIVLWRASAGNPHAFSQIFWYLLQAYDTHGNLLLALTAACAFILRRRPQAVAAVLWAAEHPWSIAAGIFPLLCLGSLRVYHDYPLSMDEYAAVFQAKAFAAGKLSGNFPPDLLDRLLPWFHYNVFLNVSRATGEVSTTYWPGFALLLAPFAWLDIPWAANPAIAALTIPVVHKLARQVTGSQEAAGWAVALTAASPAFIVASISYYSMPAHLLCNALYALLLLRPSIQRALLAGFVGSVALTLHQPVPHLLFGLPFVVWLFVGPKPAHTIGALALGYLPLSLVLGAGWHYHLLELGQAAQATGPPPAGPTGAVVIDSITGRFGGASSLPGLKTIEARIAGLSKVWTWGTMGIVVLAAHGYKIAAAKTESRLLGAALAITFFGYFFFSPDQGHGWGYRYIHSAWFVIPVLASIALTHPPSGKEGAELRAMAAWGIAVSLLFANGSRLVQVEVFMDRHLSQVPPLARVADAKRPELVFVDIASGFYTHDMVQNDPFLRTPRITMVYDNREGTAALVARRFPGYVRSTEGKWGELWVRNP